METANLVAGELVACEEDSCDIFNNGEWNHFVDTRERRVFHSTAVKDDRLLLIGGRILKHRMDSPRRLSFTAGAF